MVENILLASADGTGYVPLNVDENGTFAEYVPTGDYVIVAAPMLNGDGVMESLRMPISVNADSSQRIDLNLSMVEAVEVTLTLMESGTNQTLSGKRVVMVSHDGYGNITMNPTDADGNATQLLMPGTSVSYTHLTLPTNREV